MFDGLRILVTGCSVFLCPCICERLLNGGAHVTGADVQFQPESRIHEIDSDRLDLVELDVEQIDKIEKVYQSENIELVFHLAAQALVGKALDEPLKTISTNVMGTVNVLEAARRLPKPLKGIIVASSDKAYGDQAELPYLEDAPMLGRFPYDVSKSCADLIARSYFHTYRLPVTVVRCGNLYGGGDLNWSRIVPGTIKSLLEGTRPIVRSDGTLVRDYIYVDDAADAIARLAGQGFEDDTIYGEAFNISSDNPLSVIELVELIREVMDRKDLEPLIENSARGEIQEQYLSSKLLQDRIGWKPSTSIHDGLQRTVAWYREYAHIVK
jgi:CDP-glucose 4,6-dehydratase